MSDFPTLLKDKISEKALNAADAAVAIGVSAPSLRTALSGKSFPNARSLNKYSSFLGLSDAETKALIDAAKPAPGSKTGKKPGRKPGQKSASKKSPKAGNGTKAGKMAKAGKPGRKPKASSSTAAAIEAVVAALKQADGLMGDSLAVAVHRLNAGPRKIVEAIVKSLN